MENNKTNTPAIRVGVVDDHILVATAFTRLLKDMNGIEPVMEVYSGEELLHQLKTATVLPDILLMDIVMDGIGGIEATEQITELYPEIKVIAVTGEDNED